MVQRDKQGSPKFAKITQMLQTKRVQTARSFRQIRHLSAKLPEFQNPKCAPDVFQLYFNMISVAQSTALGLILVNGDLTQLPDEFLEVVSCVCFGVLRQGSRVRLASFEDVYLNYIDALGKLGTTGGRSPRDSRRLAEYSLGEFGHVVGSKFLLCELLFILYETLLHDVNDISQTVKSAQEARYVDRFRI